MTRLQSGKQVASKRNRRKYVVSDEAGPACGVSLGQPSAFQADVMSINFVISGQGAAL